MEKKSIKKLHENLNSAIKTELTDLATKPIDKESTLRCLKKMLKLREAYEGSCRVESYTRFLSKLGVLVLWLQFRKYRGVYSTA